MAMSNYRVMAVVILLLSGSALQAQRQMESLGRGVVALRSSSSQAYIGWRLLATDSSDIGFNVYRSVNGHAGVKLNSTVITNTTDYLDTTADFTSSNAWYVVAVVNGTEQTPSTSVGLPANSPVGRYLRLPLQPPINDGLNYDVKFCWVGDFDGDGEYDYLVDRTSTTGGMPQYLQAYRRDGTFLWQVDMGPLSTNAYNGLNSGAAEISVGDNDNVTVYDLDGDGRSEVIVRTADGTVLPGDATVTATNDTLQYLSILNGLTGTERARALIPNPYIGYGPAGARFGIAYLDGIHPSIVACPENRDPSGGFHGYTVTWDFRNGQLTQRWLYQFAAGENSSEGHQLRIADVNHDGKDEIIRIGSVMGESNGVPYVLYSTELHHGDRFHVGDLDPERPGLEMFAIQQNNSTLLTTVLQDMGSGELFKKWYSGSVVDVGRGLAADIDPGYRGYEVFSTQPGMFDAHGNQIGTAKPWPSEGIWWNADLCRESFSARDGSGLRPCINRWDYTSQTETLVYNVQSEGVHSAYGARPAFFGDILGDWREEFVVVEDNYSALRIYSTTTPATNRLYGLMQNPQYRVQCTFKGYYQASYVDYYLGNDMPPPPIPPVSNAQLVWRGGSSNTWDASTTANWLTNNLWISNTVGTVFTTGESVLFDASGSSNTTITLSGSLSPGDVRVWSPKDYTFAGTGQLTGTMALAKAGAGRLILKGTNTYTGKTLVSEGSLVVNGALRNSPVTIRGGVWRDGRLSGTGVINAAVRLEEGGGVAPGQGTNSPGTLTISNSLVLAGRTISDFDLSSSFTNNTTRTNDLLIVTGGLTLAGTNTLVIRKLNTTLATNGLYPLISYSGTLSGGLSNLTVAGLTGIPYALTNPPGKISLSLKSYRAASTITWTGGSNSNAWDLLNTKNWLSGTTRAQFVPGDTIRFNSVGASNPAVNLVGDLNCANVLVDSTTNYTLAGNGAIIGTASLTKSNSGTLTINLLNNTYTGKTTVAGGTLVVPELDAIGYPSPIGNPPGGSTNLILTGNSTLRITSESYTDRGLTLGASSTNSLDVTNAADQVTMAGMITGAGTLQKLGAGTLALTVSNSYTGGTLIKAGVLSLGGDAANEFAFGTGLVTLVSGTINMYDNSSSYNSTYWNLLVPAGSSGTLNADGRADMYGSLTGGGALTFHVPYVRTTLFGNWSAFTGQVFVTGSDFRINNGYGYAGAAIDLASGVFAYHMTGGTPVAAGALSGASDSKISGAAWTIGARNTNTTFAGNIAGQSITKVGTGTWTLTGSNYYTGATTISAGTLMVNGDSGAATGTVTVASGATLAGIGTIGGPTTIQNGGRLSPGTNAIGTLTFADKVTCNAGSTNSLKINKTAGTADLVDAGGTLTYGGTLIVTNLSGTLSAGDRFKVFNAAAYTGAFTSIILPTVAGFQWNTSKLTVAGTLWVVSTNAVSTALAAVSGRNFTFNGSGGTPAWDYYVLTSTNLMLPLASWPRIVTNQFDPLGNWNVNFPFDPSQRQRFFSIQVP